MNNNKREYEMVSIENGRIALSRRPLRVMYKSDG